MHVERFAGAFMLLSLALVELHSTKWLWFTAFVGLSLFQSGLTNWCGMMYLLKLLGAKPCSAAD